jgi:UrcA family protein
MKAIVTALALASMTVPAVAAPAPAPAVHSTAVETADLDLAAQDGQKVLALRIHRAAQVLCAADAAGSLPQTMRGERRCMRDAASSAMAMAAAKTRLASDEPMSGSARLARASRPD